MMNTLLKSLSILILMLQFAACEGLRDYLYSQNNRNFNCSHDPSGGCSAGIDIEVNENGLHGGFHSTIRKKLLNFSSYRCDVRNERDFATGEMISRFKVDAKYWDETIGATNTLALELTPIRENLSVNSVDMSSVSLSISLSDFDTRVKYITQSNCDFLAQRTAEGTVMTILLECTQIELTSSLRGTTRVDLVGVIDCDLTDYSL